MLKTPILHPQILAALGRAGHSSKILIADGNYPFHTKRGPSAMFPMFYACSAARVPVPLCAAFPSASCASASFCCASAVLSNTRNS